MNLRNQILIIVFSFSIWVVMRSDVDATMLACIAFSCPNLESLEIFTSSSSINRINGYISISFKCPQGFIWMCISNQGILYSIQQKQKEVQLQVKCKTRVEGRLEVGEMHILYNHKCQHEGFQITLFYLSFQIHHNKAPKFNFEIHMSTTKSKHKLFTLN